MGLQGICGEEEESRGHAQRLHEATSSCGLSFLRIARARAVCKCLVHESAIDKVCILGICSLKFAFKWVTRGKLRSIIMRALTTPSMCALEHLSAIDRAYLQDTRAQP